MITKLGPEWLGPCSIGEKLFNMFLESGCCRINTSSASSRLEEIFDGWLALRGQPIKNVFLSSSMVQAEGHIWKINDHSDHFSECMEVA